MEKIQTQHLIAWAACDKYRLTELDEARMKLSTCGQYITIMENFEVCKVQTGLHCLHAIVCTDVCVPGVYCMVVVMWLSADGFLGVAKWMQ